MERSRSKRSYYYDQDYESETLGRTKPRYNNSHHHQHHHYAPGPPAGHRHRGGVGGGGGVGHRQDPSLSVTTNYRILCHDMRAGGVIGKAGSIIKSIRQHTGAWINVHELVPGDSERIIEISDTRRRDPEGRIPNFSPAQEALLAIHERLLECEGGYGGGGYGEDGGGAGSGRAVTRLVVSRAHVGSLLGKGGKIIEQMRIETKTQIRILPRDQTLPRCVTMADEIVQVVGDANNVKSALAIISSRLKESQHRDRSHFQGRVHSPDRFYPPEDDFVPHGNHPTRRSSIDGNNFGSRSGSTSMRGNNHGPRASGFPVEADSTPVAENSQPLEGEELIFRILCPSGKIGNVVSETDGIIDLLHNEIGVVVKISDPVVGSDEQVITVSSEEGPDDELFPAQEALLHIQTHIVDLFPDKDNVIITRLLVPSRDVGCLEGKDGSLSHIRRLTGANVQILPREQLPTCVFGGDELVQIVGEIKAAREALVEVTSRLKSHLYGGCFYRDSPSPGTTTGEAISPDKANPVRDAQTSANPSTAAYESMQNVPVAQPPKDNGGCGIESGKQTEGGRREEGASGLSRIAVPLVTRSTLEVVIPEHAVPKLITKSRNKLSQISELSGANVILLEDRPDVTQKIIQISGTPEQAERAQSLLQGFILSTQEDGQ
ncbi:RNA-binding KH domain-containing protein RCF3 [Punica granatum]|uniref:RNA-binding KH domain-containing protein RCF3 n=1 Tax=Punica granatum TaxID=22663 RepID=A0A6P8CC09_PUNGR|nr:RNA-binding KH domain-containing protein RCF3 [Punica granatum]